MRSQDSTQQKTASIAFDVCTPGSSAFQSLPDCYPRSTSVICNLFRQPPDHSRSARLPSADLSYGKELPEKISKFIDRPDHGKRGVVDRVLSFHRNETTPDIDHGAHFIFDTEGLEPIGPFDQGIEKINHP